MDNLLSVKVVFVSYKLAVGSKVSKLGAMFPPPLGLVPNLNTPVDYTALAY